MPEAFVLLWWIDCIRLNRRDKAQISASFQHIFIITPFINICLHIKKSFQWSVICRSLMKEKNCVSWDILDIAVGILWMSVLMHRLPTLYDVARCTIQCILPYSLALCIAITKFICLYALRSILARKIKRTFVNLKENVYLEHCDWFYLRRTHSWNGRLISPAFNSDLEWDTESADPAKLYYKFLNSAEASPSGDLANKVSS